jgi:uncharacterized protein
MPILRHAIAMSTLAAMAWVGLRLHANLGAQASFILIAGAAFGFVLQRSRFCFFCILREWFEDGEVGGMIGIIAALLVGTLGYLVLLGAWVPDPGAGFLPPRAHIGPVSWVLILGGLSFGIGMSLSGSCISAHLYRLGEGNWLSLFALLGTVFGFILGFLAWNRLWTHSIAESSPLWLPEKLGYAGAGALQIGVLLIGLIWLLTRKRSTPLADRPSPSPGLSMIWQQFAIDRWPGWIGGVAVGLIGMVMYLRADPLGVTAELSRHSRHLGQQLGLGPDRLEGLDRLAGCIVTDTARLIGNNGIFVLATIAAAFAAALLAGQFRLEKRSPRSLASALTGGLLLGFGAMIALGCSIGTLLSGISAMAISGWLFGLSMVLGVWISLPLRRWLV